MTDYRGRQGRDFDGWIKLAKVKTISEKLGTAEAEMRRTAEKCKDPLRGVRCNNNWTDIMEITWADLTVSFDENTSARLIEDWIWLIGDDKTPILVSSIGDLFLKDSDNNVHWLNVGDGTLTKVATGVEDFKAKLQDQETVSDWFMVDLIGWLKEEDNLLKPGQVYSYKKLISLGGDYSTDNFEPTDIEVHFSTTGQIHKQVKDLPRHGDYS